MKLKYYIKYPYTFTISLLFVINITSILCMKESIDWIKYINTMVFTLIFGIAQIHGLENLGNVPAWFFPKGSSFFQDRCLNFYKNIIIEDLFFIPCCSSMFYLFMTLIHNIPDIFNNKYIIIYGLLFFTIAEALIYQAGGKGARFLMIAYTLIPIIILLIIRFNFTNVNVTHAFLSLLFVFVINCGWELFNSWRRHWVYDKRCDLFSPHGWVLNDKLHVSIFVQYAISGWVVMYFCYLIF